MKLNKAMLLALTPAALLAVYLFRTPAVILIAASVAGSVAAEVGFQLALKRPLAIKDLSAVITGLLLALTLSPSAPWYTAALGAAVGTVVGKELAGGYLKNIFNPALFGRLFIIAAFPGSLSPWLAPYDLTSTATPLGLMREEGTMTAFADLFLGTVPGSLGETSVLLIALGTVYLIYRRFVNWRIPVSILATVFVLMLLFGENPIFHLMSGSLMIGACFMATDPATSPRTQKGRWVFGIGVGIIVVAFRLWGWLPEGVTFGILGMNAAVPLINERTKRKKAA